MNVLIIESVKYFQNTLVMELEASFDFNVVVADSYQSAVDILESEEFQFIICGSLCVKEFKGCLLRHVLSRKKSIPYLVFGQYDLEHLTHGCGVLVKDLHHVQYLKRPCSRETLIERVEQLTGASAIKSATHVRVRTQFIRQFNELPTDVFLKVSKKFLKIIHACEPFETKVVDKYAEEGIVHLYVRRDDLPSLFQQMERYTKGKMWAQTKAEVDRSASEHKTISSVQKVVKAFGISSAVIKMVDEIVFSNIIQLKKISKVFDLLKHIQTSDHFSSTHALSLCYLTCQVAKSLGWDSEEFVKKMSYASLFHDLFLTDEQAILHDLESEEMDYRPEEKQEIIQHPKKAYDLIMDNYQIPADVGTIVLHHHEKPDGSGYPRGIRLSAIPFTSLVFNICEALIIRLHKHDAITKDDISHHIIELEKEYLTSKTEKLFDILKQLIK